MTVSSSIQYAFVSMPMSSSRSARESSLRIPCLGDVVAMLDAYRARSGGKRSAWNGRDFYYSAGEGDRRRWADMVCHGFVSAGGGRWYSRTLRALEPGHRVWAHIPRVGYVGVGEVLAGVVPVTETGLLDEELEAPAMDRGRDDPDRREYVVRTRWLVAWPREEAFWIPGMYANENSVTKLRDEWTLQRLCEAFGVG
jgi:hypothetical protein